MKETIQFQYGINYTIASMLLMLIFMLLLLSNVVVTNSEIAWIIYGFFTVFFLFMIRLLILKRLIPALKGNVALELNEQGIIDYIRNITMDWKDIEDISLIRSRSASTLRIDLKWESDYGRQIAIPLSWIKGKDKEIYSIVMSYIESDEK